MKRIIAAAVGISMLLGTTAFADSITLSLGNNISQTITQQEQQRANFRSPFSFMCIFFQGHNLYMPQAMFGDSGKQLYRRVKPTKTVLLHLHRTYSV